MQTTGLTIEAADYLSGIDTTRITKRRYGKALVSDIKLCGKGSAAIGRAAGRYITVEGDPSEHSVVTVLSKALEQLIPRRGVILVAGLGNPDIAWDSLGTECVNRILPLAGSRHSVAAVQTDITARTGIETAAMVRGMARELKAACVIAVDSLVCSNPSGIARMVQLSDTGIQPASGVGEERAALTAEYVGVPVVAVGVPLAASLRDITGVEAHSGYLASAADVDILSSLWAETLAEVIMAQAER